MFWLWTSRSQSPMTVTASPGSRWPRATPWRAGPGRRPDRDHGERAQRPTDGPRQASPVPPRTLSSRSVLDELCPGPPSSSAGSPVRRRAIWASPRSSGRSRPAGRTAGPAPQLAAGCPGDGGQVRLDRRRAVDPELDPVVEVQPGVPAQVLDRALQLARVALGAQVGVSVVSITTTRPSSWATAVPGRGVAWISTSSAASVTPASVTEPSAGLEVTAAGGGHDRRDRRTQALADPREQDLDPPLHEVGPVADPPRP